MANGVVVKGQCRLNTVIEIQSHRRLDHIAFAFLLAQRCLMSPGSTTKEFLSAVTFRELSFAEISRAFTKSSAFLESIILKFAKMLEVAIVVPPSKENITWSLGKI